MTRVEVIVLGSGGVIPTKERLTTSIMISDWNGYTLLLDAGEGVQVRISQTSKSIHDIDAIIITHDHGDHINGVAGLLQSMTVGKRTRSLVIGGPESAIEFVRETLEAYGSNLGFPIYYLKLSGTGSTTLYTRGGDKLVLSWTKSCHSRDSLAYRLDWILRPRIIPQKIWKLGVRPGPWIKDLLDMGEISIDGLKIRLQEVSVPGGTLSITYTGDTAPCSAIVQLAEKTDLLIHEATYTAELYDEALLRGHSSSIHAAMIAKESNARMLLLVHVSPRYRGLEARKIEREARRIFPRSMQAWDLVRISLGISRRSG